MSADVYLHLFNVETYEERVVPAYGAFLSENDPDLLLGLIKDCMAQLEAYPQLSNRLLWNRELFEEDVGIINGTMYYSPDAGKTSNQSESKTGTVVRHNYAREQLSSKIVEILCVPYDKNVNPEQDMTNSRLVPYLYDRSDWITELFTFSRTVRGRLLEFGIGESSEEFTKEDLQEFDDALGQVEPPAEAQLRAEYDNLRALVKTALETPNLTLTLSVFI